MKKLGALARGGKLIPVTLMLSVAPCLASICADDFVRGTGVGTMTSLSALAALRNSSKNEDDRLYSEASFAATHNSYAGGDGVGSIRAQLDRGVRLLELDVHDDDFARFGYRIGHADVGDRVFHEDGNPASSSLDDWLKVIDDWSNAHPRHAPITILLDLKDSIADNASFREGDLFALNRELEKSFGTKLYAASQIDGKSWPTVGALRGRILVVLSGNEDSRIAYRGAKGRDPSVAINSSGKVIEVHGSGNGELWYWAGQYENGRISWRRTGRYDTGQMPSIDLNEDGLVVEVHEDPDLNDYQLWYRVGRLQDDFEIAWMHPDGLAFPGEDYGQRPTVRFNDKQGSEVREVHLSPTSSQRWYWSGRFDADLGGIAWSRAEVDRGRTDEPLFIKDSDRAGAMSVSVLDDASGFFGDDTLLYQTDRLAAQRIRPPQIAFVELQHGSTRALANDDLFFCAASAAEPASRSWVNALRGAGKIARIWGFNGSGVSSDSAAISFPATDLPFSSWYDEYCRLLGCVR
jgi:hypothetical protein